MNSSSDSYAIISLKFAAVSISGKGTSPAKAEVAWSRGDEGRTSSPLVSSSKCMHQWRGWEMPPTLSGLGGVKGDGWTYSHRRWEIPDDGGGRWVCYSESSKFFYFKVARGEHIPVIKVRRCPQTEWSRRRRLCRWPVSQWSERGRPPAMGGSMVRLGGEFVRWPWVCFINVREEFFFFLAVG